MRTEGLICTYCRLPVDGQARIIEMNLIHPECHEGFMRGREARWRVMSADLAAEALRKQREKDPEYMRQVLDNERRSKLPSEHPDHICGILCDGQDGSNSFCARVRRELGFGRD